MESIGIFICMKIAIFIQIKMPFFTKESASVVGEMMVTPDFVRILDIENSKAIGDEAVPVMVQCQGLGKSCPSDGPVPGTR